jgi:hypothetical protein
VKDKNQYNPTINTCQMLNVWVGQHPFDVSCICLDNEISNSNEVHVKHLKSAKYTIEFKFQLQEMYLSFIQGEQKEAIICLNFRIAWGALAQKETYHNVGCVDYENDSQC